MKKSFLALVLSLIATSAVAASVVTSTNGVPVQNSLNGSVVSGTGDAAMEAPAKAEAKKMGKKHSAPAKAAKKHVVKAKPKAIVKAKTATEAKTMGAEVEGETPVAQ